MRSLLVVGTVVLLAMPAQPHSPAAAAPPDSIAGAAAPSPSNPDAATPETQAVAELGARWRSWFPIEKPKQPEQNPRTTQEASQPPGDGPAPLLPIDAHFTIRRGDTFKLILTKAGVSATEAERAIRALAKVYDPRRLKPGLEIFLQLQPATDGAKRPNLLSIDFVANYELDVSVLREEDGSFNAETYRRALTPKLSYRRGVIDSSLYEAGVAAEIAPRVLAGLVNLYSFDVDFQRDVHPGDSFEIAYEQLMDESGAPVRDGDIAVASMTLAGKTTTLYRFETKTGKSDYFDENGNSARKSLLRTPTDATRISSRFGRRKHPILGYTRIHRGIDFAAPAGTPVYAAGDGKVEKAKWSGGYGKYIRIRHNKTHKTAYAHLRRFARGIKAGRKVKQRQIIGYVGSTGRSTGPHLHFEVIRNGKQINPQRLRLAAGYKLRGKELKRFRKSLAAIKNRLATLRQGHKRQSTMATSEPACASDGPGC